MDVLLGDELDALSPRETRDGGRGCPGSFLRDLRPSRLERGERLLQEGLKGGKSRWKTFASSARRRAALPAAAFLDSLDEALLLAERFPTVPIVTRSRELVRGSLVRVFRMAPEAEGLFALRRELEDLEGRVGQEREDVAGFDHSLEDLRRQKTEREGRLPELRERERRANTALSSVSARAAAKTSPSSWAQSTPLAESAQLADEAGACLAPQRNRGTGAPPPSGKNRSALGRSAGRRVAGKRVLSPRPRETLAPAHRGGGRRRAPPLARRRAGESSR